MMENPEEEEEMLLALTPVTGEHPIFEAVEWNRVSLVKANVKYNPRVLTMRNAIGFTPMLWSVRAEHAELVAWLLDNGADVNQQSDPEGSTGLLVACSNSYGALVSLLLSRGADVNLADAQGTTPLTLSALREDVGIVSALLRHGGGCDVHARDEQGHNALWPALTYGREETVSLLLSAGADPMAIDATGQSPLSAMHSWTPDCIRHLRRWDRAYSLTKARLLYEASVTVGQERRVLWSPHVRSHIKPPMRYLMKVCASRAAVDEHMEGLVIHTMNAESEAAGCGQGCREVTESDVAARVAVHVVEGLSAELFVELMTGWVGEQGWSEEQEQPYQAVYEETSEELSARSGAQKPQRRRRIIPHFNVDGAVRRFLYGTHEQLWVW